MKPSLAFQIFFAAIFCVAVPFVSRASAAPSEYILGPGDVLSVTNGDGSVASVPIHPDGRAVVKYAGTVEAAGVFFKRPVG